jgi:ABC-type glycerol-3-phosphate transport system permease component
MRSRDSRPPFKLENLLHFVGLLIVLIVCVFHFYWMVAAYLKSPTDILLHTPILLRANLAKLCRCLGKFDILKA